LSYFFHRLRLCSHLDKKILVGLHFGRLFHKLIWPPCSSFQWVPHVCGCMCTKTSFLFGDWEWEFVQPSLSLSLSLSRHTPLPTQPLSFHGCKYTLLRWMSHRHGYGYCIQPQSSSQFLAAQIHLQLVFGWATAVAKSILKELIRRLFRAIFTFGAPKIFTEPKLFVFIECAPPGLFPTLITLTGKGKWAKCPFKSLTRGLPYHPAPKNIFKKIVS
jgi:hypothetical protein